MKQIFTLLAIVITGSLTAQTLDIRTAAGVSVTGTTVVHTGLATDAEIVSTNFYVHNTSGATVAVRCSREEISVVPNTYNSLCWAICSSDQLAGSTPVLIAPGGTVPISAGDSINLYVLHYKPTGYSGTSLFKVKFYNPSVSADTAVFFVQFDAALSVSETAAPSLAINAYPNPANSYINIDVDNFSEKATLRIVDALGVTVKTATINGEANLKFNTTDLREGVYFYSLISNNKTILTRRLVITR